MYILETSWEVCNRIGGIYAVLSTRAASMHRLYGDKVIFFGPDLGQDDSPASTFIESPTLLSAWRRHAAKAGLSVRVGRWNVPGQPIAVLVKYDILYPQKNGIYGHVWERFGVNSIAAYGDYDESAMFGSAVGMVMESFYLYHKVSEPCVAHFNEWMTAFGLFYIKEHLPRVGTLFTTHATSIGRSIAGNDKPLYDCLGGYDGDQMARELNMISKHSVEKTAAHTADCFTTVSTITDRECAQLLRKPADVVTPNGFEADFVPTGNAYQAARRSARTRLLKVASTLLGEAVDEKSMLLAISGRYEFKNKGIDVFIDVMKQLNDHSRFSRPTVAFIMVPAWSNGPRHDLGQALAAKRQAHGASTEAMFDPVTTHRLHDPEGDRIMSSLNWHGLNNQVGNRVKVIYVPTYLNGDDGIFNLDYYHLLIGMDLTLFPSYYEPWGYTPLESVAFGIPTITTSLSGFGRWAAQYSTDAAQGVGVVERSDQGYWNLVRQITDMVLHFSTLTPPQLTQARASARRIAGQALWSQFFKHYEEAYRIALNHANPQKQ